MNHNRDSLQMDGVAGGIDESRASRRAAFGAVDVDSDRDDRFKLTLPFESAGATARVGDAASASVVTPGLATLRLDDGADVSARIARQERISRPVAPTYLPGTKQRRPRSVLTLVISLVAALALVVAGVLFSVKSLGAAEEQTAINGAGGFRTALLANFADINPPPLASVI
ncbi:hypothetical protein [Mycetocola zhujimingii]|uniref:hypothetical protein n=1 Tax=Mycetocola zhujimingii TaxID=2079792 RepID=UPI0013C4C1EC|nr:hypothetical protein [Mycetocola zhujimingii]